MSGMPLTASLLKLRPFWLACGAGFIVLVIYLSLMRNPIQAPVWFNFKIGHMLAYGWLMFWYLQIYRRWTQRAAIAVALCLMGVALEYAQGMTGYRDFAYSDMRDNAMGVAIGLSFALTPFRDTLLFVESTTLGSRR
jgi:hypothetical protein